MPIPLRRRLNRPEYVFNPRATLARAFRRPVEPWDVSDTMTIRLPWSDRITLFPDQLGKAVVLTGIFDITASETVHRLLDPGAVAVDVGANVGYLTSLMAARAGSGGRVIAFEPHPEVFALLERNAEHWNVEPGLAHVEPNRIALSDRSGTGRLTSPGEPHTHMGMSALARDGKDAGDTDFEVDLGTFDEVIGADVVQLLKIDVEGHEHAVIEGAKDALANGMIRDVIFEDHGIYPTPAMTLLEEHDMTVFSLRHTLFGPRLHPVEQGPASPDWPGPNYLATREPARAADRLAARGWNVLRGAGIGRSTAA